MVNKIWKQNIEIHIGDTPHTVPTSCSKHTANQILQTRRNKGVRKDIRKAHENMTKKEKKQVFLKTPFMEKCLSRISESFSSIIQKLVESFVKAYANSVTWSFFQN